MNNFQEISAEFMNHQMKMVQQYFGLWRNLENYSVIDFVKIKPHGVTYDEAVGFFHAFTRRLLKDGRAVQLPSAFDDVKIYKRAGFEEDKAFDVVQPKLPDRFLEIV